MMSFITDAGSALSKIYNGKVDEPKMGLGSNAFAVSSKKSADGSWLPARNLGPDINSEVLDYCPFVDVSRGIFFFTSPSFEGGCL